MKTKFLSVIYSDSFVFVFCFVAPSIPVIHTPDKPKTIEAPDRSPITLTIGDNVTALTNTSITIQCPTSGVPTPTVTWTKDGQEIPSEGRYTVQDDGSLMISEADEKHNARYTCTADSVAGKNKASSTVQVVGKLNSMVYGEIMRAVMNRQLLPISIKRKVLKNLDNAARATTCTSSKWK